MKLLMIIVESSHKEELEVLINRNDIVGYTEIPDVRGAGESGIRMGSAAFPKTSSIIFTIVAASKLKALVDDIKTYCGDACAKKMKMVVWGVEELV
jgi:hypothetical protein